MIDNLPQANRGRRATGSRPANQNVVEVAAQERT